MVCYNIIGLLEDTRGAIIIVDIFNIIQEVPDTGIHLKVDEEHGSVAQGSKRQVSGEPTQILVRATAHQIDAPHAQYLSN